MKLFVLLFLLTTPLFAEGYQLSPKTTQAIVGITENWNSSYANLGMYEKKKGKWLQTSTFWKVRIGRNGSAWGLGLSPAMGKNFKKEGDGRAPVGVFAIGGAYGYAPSIKKYKSLPYHQVTSRDLWVEDTKSKSYNRHIQLKHEPKSAWEKKQQMRQGDYAHALKLYIGHNTASDKKPAKPGFGSAIFFHIWRGGGSKATSGCTTMDPSKLKTMISQIDPKKNPVYILLPRSEYMKYRQSWKLP